MPLNAIDNPANSVVIIHMSRADLDTEGVGPQLVEPLAPLRRSSRQGCVEVRSGRVRFPFRLATGSVENPVDMAGMRTESPPVHPEPNGMHGSCAAISP